MDGRIWSAGLSTKINNNEKPYIVSRLVPAFSVTVALIEILTLSKISLKLVFDFALIINFTRATAIVLKHNSL